MIETKDAMTELADQKLFLQTVIDSVPTPIYCKDIDGVYICCNTEFAKFIGRPVEEIVGKTVFDVSPLAFADKNDSSDRNIMRKGGTIVFESAVKYPDGSLHEVTFHKAVFSKTDGTTAGVIATMVDVTLRKQAEQQLRVMANSDPLTEIPNRNLGRDRLIGALARSRRTKMTSALLFVDLDGFKEVNDTHGHETGDSVLKEVARRLVRSVRETDTVSRFGGDEFTILVTDIKEKASIRKIVETVREALVPPIVVGEKALSIGASIGIAVYPDDGQDPESLIRAADTAMYAVKTKGKGTYKFATEPVDEAAQ